ncbi:MAG: hypothetical protein ACREMI_04950 [Gemmatimonadales bacterium]
MNGAGTLRAAPAFTADSVGRLAERANVIADSGVVVMHTIGLAVIVAEPAPLEVANPLIGDTLEILNPVREDVKRVRWHGLEFNMQIEERGRLIGGLQMIREPVVSWWVYMTDTAAHQAGWLRMGGMSSTPNAPSTCGG